MWEKATKAKISFWSEISGEEYYVVKQKKGTEQLTALNAVHDHISNAIYQLFGVCTPDYYIGTYQKKLSLISNIMTGYKDLVEWLKGDEDAIEEINTHDKVEECIAAYKKLESGLSVQGKESLLAAAIILEDTDVLGAGLRNIGLIETAGKHKIIKIDPGNGIFDVSTENIDSAMKEFESDLSLDNPLIYKPFSYYRLFNNPKSILGNLHLGEFFHDIDKDKLVSELAKFASLEDEFIKNLIVRDEYFELISADKKKGYLEHLSDILIRKKAILKKVLKLPEIKSTPPEPSSIFINDIELSAPLEQIKHGASMPFKVKRINPTTDSLVTSYIRI